MNCDTNGVQEKDESRLEESGVCKKRRRCPGLTHTRNSTTKAKKPRKTKSKVCLNFQVSRFFHYLSSLRSRVLRSNLPGEGSGSRVGKTIKFPGYLDYENTSRGLKIYIPCLDFTKFCDTPFLQTLGLNRCPNVGHWIWVLEREELIVEVGTDVEGEMGSTGGFKM